MAKLDPKVTAQLKKDLKEINDFYKKIGAQELKVDIDVADIDDLKLVKEYLKDARDESDLLFGNFRDVKAEVDEIFSGLNSITDEIKNGRQGFDLTKSAVAKLTTVMGQVKDIQDDITNANTDDLRKLQEKALAERKNLLEAQRLLSTHENINDKFSREYIALQNINGILADQDGLFGEIDKTLQQVVRNSEIVDKNFGFKSFDVLGDAFSKIPGLSKISGPFKDASGAAKSMAEGIESAASSGGKGLTKEKIKQLGLEKQLGNLSGTAAANKLKGMSGMKKGMLAFNAGFKALGPIISKALGPVGLIIEAVKAFMQMDKAAGETAKSMGISYNEAQKLNAEMSDAAAMSGDLLISTQDVVKANAQLNEIMGTGAQFAGEMAVEFAQISEKTGLSAAAMKKFTEGAMIGGKTIKDQLVDVTAVTQELNAQNKVAFSAKDIQEGIAQLSKTQQLQAGLNTKEMAKQVFQQKLLGLNAQQLEGVQSSMLDFESSIAAEMEAELLTGKQLNLEGARAAALAGDQAALAAEIRKEVGTAAEFGEMNVIQQEALAKAFGMSREDMAGMLIEQEKLAAMQKAFGGDIKTASEAQAEFNRLSAAGELTEAKKKELAEAGVLAQLESASAQDRMNAAMEKLSDLFLQLVEPLMPLIDSLMGILEPVFAILSPIFKLVGDITSLTMSILMPAIDALVGAFEGLASGFEDIFGGLFDIIGGILTMDFDMILDGFKSVASGAISMLMIPFQALTDLVVGAINLVIRGVNYIPGVDIGEIESPDLAGEISGLIGLSDGGIIPATPGGVPALIGEGGEDEVVMPLSRLSDLIPGMGGIMGAAGGLMDTVGGLFGGESEDVTQLKELNQKISKLIAVVEKGGDVRIDGNKVGKSMALATSNIG
jgi:hypothetical protein